MPTSKVTPLTLSSVRWSGTVPIGSGAVVSRCRYFAVAPRMKWSPSGIDSDRPAAWPVREICSEPMVPPAQLKPSRGVS